MLPEILTTIALFALVIVVPIVGARDALRRSGRPRYIALGGLTLYVIVALSVAVAFVALFASSSGETTPGEVTTVGPRQTPGLSDRPPR